MSTAITAILALSSVALCSASQITARLLNGKTDLPMPNKQVVAWINIKPTPRTFEGRTDREGVALIHLPEDQSIDTITVSEATYHQLISCTHWDWQDNQFPFKTVLESGVVAVNTCDPKGKLKPSPTAKPAEIVIFAREPNWWEAFWMRGQH